MEGLMEMSDHLLSSTLPEYEIKAEYKSACLPVQGLFFSKTAAVSIEIESVYSRGMMLGVRWEGELNDLI